MSIDGPARQVPEKTLLVDGNNLLMRALFAMAHSGLSDSRGLPTGPLLVFINTLSRHVIEEAPDRVMVCWDGGRSERRTASSDDYKAQRGAGPVIESKESAFGLAKEFLTLAGVPHVERPGLEADDLIGHFWRSSVGWFKRRVILSSDKDFLQLVDGNTDQVRLSSSGTPTDRWDLERVMTAYECPPDMLPYAMALAGDTVDGVVGLPRIGMKTAVKILRASGWFWSDALKHPKVEPHRELAEKNLPLVDLRRSYESIPVDPQIPLFRPTGPDSQMFEGLLKFLSEHDMRTVRARIISGALWSSQDRETTGSGD